ncbi:MAG TPA: hypothetical protein VMW76_10125 [Bacteroidales bacterium]|nr:hypothetical protein [Bacteroidales bacterium]
MELSKFESRTGKICASDKVVYNFITDMRNFGRFIPGGTIENWNAATDSCSFELSPVGGVKLSIIGKEPFSTVKFAGDGLNNTRSYLWIQLKQVAENDTRVKITIKAGINPMIRVMAAKPIDDFLEKLVSGLENFSDWDTLNG